MIKIEKLNYSVGAFALRDVSLDIAPGEYFVLLGPSGAGKTLLLECLCGLNRVDSGRIVIDGADVTYLEPRVRGIGYLPQDYALFPHRTVRQNVGFGLINHPAPTGTGRRRVDELMDLVGLTPLADRLPGKLSGGEKQRVALARALAIEPRVLLLDEPVSALDEQTRDGICRQLKRLQRATRTTMIHVCHNFAEMLAVADRAGVIHHGEILQVGSPRELLERPRSSLVARFVQAGNLLSGKLLSGKAETNGPPVELICDGGLRLRAVAPAPAIPDGQVTVMLRPENIRLGPALPENVSEETSVIEGTVREVLDFGPTVKVTVAVGSDVELHVSLGKKEYNARPIDAGEHVFLTVAPEDVHVMAR